MADEATGSGRPSTMALARPTLRRGDIGPEVRDLRERLRDLGYHVTVGVIFGSGTQFAVRSFQRTNGLVADGVVGLDTWAALS